MVYKGCVCSLEFDFEIQKPNFCLKQGCIVALIRGRLQKLFCCALYELI